MERVIGMVGKIKNGKKEVKYNRQFFPQKLLSKCLNEAEINSIVKHYEHNDSQHDHRLSEELMNAFQQHIEGCSSCQKSLQDKIGFSEAALQVLGLGEDSIHTSGSPDRPCAPFCRTHHKLPELIFIRSWGGIKVDEQIH